MRARTRLQLLMLISWALVVSIIVPTPTAAQSTFATLTGVVTDPSGGVVPGATIDVTSVRTQAVRTTISDQAGAFLVTNLDAGLYRVLARIDGFADAAYETELLARQTVRIDVHLALAGAAERVDVTAAQPLIETDSATIDHSRSGDDINRLALNFRATRNTSPIVVATLAEGVQQDRAGAISVAGNLPFMTSFSIDGIASHSSRRGGPSRELFPSVESIAEFKVSSANNNAEFMQVTDVTTTSKSGSNQFRGTGFWFINDSALSSVNRFAPKDASGKAIKPEIQTNSYGISGGGPVLRNRTFFYGTFEGVREPNQVTLSQVVPPDAFRAGDLSSVTTAIRNPLTGQPFPNNQIPVNPASAKILSALYERQNQNTGAAINRPNYIINAPGNYDQKGFDIRGDQNVSNNQKFFARLTYKNVERNFFGGSSSAATAVLHSTKLGEFAQKTEVRQLAASHNFILTPRLLNEFRAGFSYTLDTTRYALASGGADLIRDFGFTGLPAAPAGGGVPFFEFADGSFIDTGGDKPTAVLSRSAQFNDNVTWVRGRHTVKSGLDVQYVEYKDQSSFFSGDEFGAYTFTGAFTGNAFADFLLGLPSTTKYAANPPDANPYTFQFAGYIQDDWRVSRKLTLNAGLRYDLRPPLLDRSNQLANFDRNFPGGRIIVANEAAKALIPASVKAAVPNTPIVTAAEAGLPERLRFTDKNNINPRVGLAYRPFDDDRTVVRGGFGLYTVPLYGSISYSMYAAATGDVPSFQNTQLPNGQFAIQFPNVFPAALRGIPGAGTQDFRRANQFDLRDPQVRQWTATVERELGWQAGLRVSYTGSSTVDIVYSPDLNQVRPNTVGYAAARAERPFKDWNVVTTRDNGSRARYDALGIELTKRLQRGFSFASSYTLARHNSDSGGAVPTAFTGENGPSVLNLFRGDADYGPVAFTRRHRSVTTFLYALPFDASGPAGILAGGWDLAGILLVQSGSFQTAQFSNRDPSGTGANVRGFTSTQRPDQIGEGNISSPTVDRYWDVNAFVLPGNNIGRFGNGAVGTLIAPGTTVFSLNVGKNFRIVGTSRARFEIAVTNLFNIENLDVPNRTITSTSFGRITSTQAVDQAGPRTVQFSLRYTF
jgi:hypothetical protein